MARALSLLVGLWLLVSGLQLQRVAPSPVPPWVVAVVVLAAELIALRVDAVRWVTFLAGVWLIISPFILRYGYGPAAFNSEVVGLALFILATYATRPAVYTEPPTYNKRLYSAQGGGRAYR